MKSWLRFARMAVVFGQLSFTLITPPVLMTLLGWWLSSRFAIGVWVIAVFLLLGLVTAGATARRLWKKYQTSMAGKDEAKNQTVMYFRHD